MGKRFLLALLLSAAVPTAISASDQNIQVDAEVAKFCQLNTASLGAFNNASGTAGLSSSTVTITTPTTLLGVMQGWGFTFTANATCNAASEIKMTAVRGGLKLPSPGGDDPPVSGFINRFDYGASADWDGAPTVQLATSGTPNVSSIPSPSTAGAPHTGTLTVHVNSPFVLPTQPLMAGFYSDTLVVSLFPQ